MSDWVERQAALDTLHGYFDNMLETDTWSPCDLYDLFENIPSAQPERKTCEGCKRSGTISCSMCSRAYEDRYERR